MKPLHLPFSILHSRFLSLPVPSALICGLGLSLSLVASEAALYMDNLSDVEVAYGSAPQTINVTGIRHERQQTSAWTEGPKYSGGFTFLPGSVDGQRWVDHQLESWRTVRDFEATFEIAIVYKGGGDKGDGWVFVFGSSSEFSSWSSGRDIEDGNGMTLAAGVDISQAPDRLFIKSGGNPSTRSKDVPPDNYLTVKITVRGDQFTMNYNNETMTITLPNYNPGPGWVFAIGARNGAWRGEYSIRNWTIKELVTQSTETVNLSMTVASSNPNAFQVGTPSYSGNGPSGSFELRPQRVAAGATSTITVTVRGTDGSSVSRSFTARVRGAPSPTLNAFTPDQDIKHIEGVNTNRSYTVQMSGISDGDPNTDNPITITASSSNTAVLDNPTVNYASPSGNGTLTLTIKEGGRAEATVTVNVRSGDTSTSQSFRVFRFSTPKPTLDPPLASQSPIRINEDAGPQSFTATGIGDGDDSRAPIPPAPTAAAPNNILKSSDPVMASSPNSPPGQGASNAIDGTTANYLNFDGKNNGRAGFAVTPSVGATVVTGMTLRSADDHPERDPKKVRLEGSNNPRLTDFNSGTWELITELEIPSWESKFPPSFFLSQPISNDRSQTQTLSFSNTKSYRSYRWTVLQTQSNADSFQIAEVQLLGTVPSTPSTSTSSATGTVPLVVTATTDNPILVQGLKVDYRGGKTATVSYFAPPNANGTATITVTVAAKPGIYPEYFQSQARISRDFTLEVQPVNDPVRAGAAGGLRFNAGSGDSRSVTNLAIRQAEALALGGEATIEYWQRVTQTPPSGKPTLRLVPLDFSDGTPDLASRAYAETNWLEAVTPGAKGKVSWAYGQGRMEVDYGSLDGLLNAWIHWAFVVNTNQNVLRIYRNGVLQGEQAGATPLAPTTYTSGSGLNAEIKSVSFGLELSGFTGDLAEFRIWRVARSEGDIRRAKDQPLLGSEPGLMVYYRFLDGDGQTVTDHADGRTQGGSQHGTLLASNSSAYSQAWILPSALGLVSTTEGQLRFVRQVSEGSVTNALSLPAFDPDLSSGDRLTFTATASHGKLIGQPSDSIWFYTPNNQYSGPETISYTVTDAQGGRSSGTIELIILARNDPPTVSTIAGQTVFENGQVTVPFSVSDPDNPPALAKISVVSTDRSVVKETGLSLRQTGTNWTLTLRPEADESGVARILVTGFDGQDSSTREFDIQVQPKPVYHVIDLGELPGKSVTEAAAINDSGQVVGWAASDSGGSNARGFFYNGVELGGVMFQVPTLDVTGGGISRAFGINSRGDITGMASYADGRKRAFRWRPDSEMIDLGQLSGGQDSEGRAINSAGTVAGWATTSGNRTPAAFWRASDALSQVQRIATLPSPYSVTNIASGINDSGWVVGTSFAADGTSRGYVVNTLDSSSTPSPLGRLATLPNSAHTNSTAVAINNSGGIAGSYTTASMPYGKVLTLDGRGQAVSSGGPLELNLPSFTVELWFKRSRTNSAETLLSQGAALRLGFDGNGQFFAFCAGSVLAGTAVADDKWHHGALVFDSDFAERVLYLDGAVVAREALAGSHVSSGLVTLGNGADGAFQGEIDEVRIWSVARNAQEVRRGKFGWMSSDEPGLMARWQFDVTSLDDNIYTKAASLLYTNDLVGPVGSAPAAQTSTNTFRLSMDAVQLGGGSAGATNVALSGNRVYVAEGSAGVEIFESAGSAVPRRLGGFDTAGMAIGVAVTGNRLLVADGNNGLVMLDITQPSAPVWIGHHRSSNGSVSAVKVVGNLAILTAGQSVEMLDLGSLGTPSLATNLVDLTVRTDSAARLGATNSLFAVLDNNTSTFATNTFSTTQESGLLLAVASRLPVSALRLVPAPAATGRSEIRAFGFLGR